MTDKQIKEKIKQVVTNLGNIEFTVENELKFCKEVLKRKEQECETLASQLDFEVQKKECLEQECEELKKDLHQNFKEKDKLHLIIDRLLEASCYDTNTASAEEFEDVYKSMCYEKQQLDKLKQTLIEIKKIAERGFQHSQCNCGAKADLDLILQKICEAINEQ